MKLNRTMIGLIIGLIALRIMTPILSWIMSPLGDTYIVRMGQVLSVIDLTGMALCVLVAIVSLRTEKSNPMLALLLVGWAVYNGTQNVSSVMVGMYCGDDALAGASVANSFINLVNVILYVFLTITLLFAHKLKSFSFLPKVSCAIELLLSLLLITLAAPCLRMLYTSEWVLGIAVSGVKAVGLGMLIGSILVVITGLLFAQKRIVWRLLVMVIIAILSIVAHFGMLVVFHMGLSSMLAIGFLQPFAFLFPVVSWEDEKLTADLKNVSSALANKSSENTKYSYLEAYKNKHK